MGFEAQDPVNLIFLRVVGALFAGVGLWLLLRPKPSGSTAKIELFGLKFESSSAGVLVFLIGAAFLAVPLFVPEKVAVQQPLGPVDPNTQTFSLSGRAALMLPPDPEVAEVEPNDRIQGANMIGFGQTVSGEVRKGNDDWFVVAVPDGLAFVDFRVRNLGEGTVSVRLFDANEKDFWRTTLFNRESDNLRMETDGNDRVYVLVWKDDYAGATGSYELAVFPVAD